MEFEFTEDQLELQRAVRDVLDAEAPPELARAVADGESDAAGFWQTLVDLEWPAMALPGSADGLGYGWVELAIVLEELGRHAAPGPFMATVTQFAAIVVEVAAPDQAAELLAPVATGRTTGTIAVDEGSGTWDPDGVQATARRDGDDLVLEGTKHYVLDGATADEIAVAVRIDGALRVVTVPGSSVQATGGIPVDPGIRHATIALDGVRVPAERLLGDGDASDAIRRALEESVTAVAAVTLGACQRIFDIINAYAKERIQFGVPIGS
ncbi:MAG: acyl-CoA/acyl-ACP dehydrogenase, partial [Acidimicrobiaceae bacterium]|nr:acyl-CoA/acyl-ACP dehydrogenase [Acidimicrobiaceae bacterium]